MLLWVDKHRPKQLSQLSYHKSLSVRLKYLVAQGDFPHLLFYGPSGAGKKTRIWCTLRELYGAGVEKIRLEHKSIETPSGKKVEIALVSSNYHIQLNPSDVAIYDRVVIQDVIKHMAQTQQLESRTQRAFKVIVLTEVDKLTREAQHALRRTMEKYSSSCRIILCCQSTSKVIQPIQSRCLPIRVPAPTDEEITEILQRVLKLENCRLSAELIQEIVQKADGNLRRALLSAESVISNDIILRRNYLSENPVIEPDWEICMKETASMILREQTPKMLLQVRGRLYELIVHCIPASLIFKSLYFELLHSCDASIKAEVTSVAAKFEYQMTMGSKVIYHLESFVAKFMSLYKHFLEVNNNF
ncbi:hypothetical protein TSPI_00431 [Trichinella spiralis]|uniref:AAA+ ATPase domain-containing protein n=1 Tax=Trichinella spiralis TaxID=6334 RepID=A0ABR3KWE3_TRISP